MSRSSRLPASDGWRRTIGIVGAVMVLAGVALTIADRDGGNVVAIVITGALLFVSPLILHRLREFSVSPDGVTFSLVTEIAQTAPDTAAILGHTELAGLAQSYAIVHAELPGDANKATRAAVEDVLLKRAADTARLHTFNADEVRSLFRQGSPVIRALALGLMEGDTSLADGETIQAAIGASRSGNEQYHGLKLAQLAWRQLAPAERSAIHGSIDRLSGLGAGRQALARQVRELPAS